MLSADSKISIITPVYNTPLNYLNACFNSIKNQTYQNIEVIVVDDGSEKKTADFCDKFWSNEKNKEVKIIHNENHGVAYSRNCGLDNASGDYIVFLDSDDEIDKNFVSLMLKAQRKLKCNLIVCDYSTDKLKDDMSSINIEKNSVLYSGIDIYFNFNTRYIWRTLYSVDILKGIRFKENLSASEDIVFFNTVLKRIRSVGYLNLKLYYYRQNPDSITHSFSEKVCKDAMSVYEMIYTNNIELKKNYEVYSEYFTGYARWIMRYVTSVSKKNNYSKFIEAKKLCTAKTKGKIKYIRKKNIKIMIILSRIPSFIYYTFIKLYEKLRLLFLEKNANLWKSKKEKR